MPGRGTAMRRRLGKLHGHIAAHSGGSAAPVAGGGGGGGWTAIDLPFAGAQAAGANASAGQLDSPLDRLARGDVPAVILRGALSGADCRALIQRFDDRGLLPEVRFAACAAIVPSYRYCPLALGVHPTVGSPSLAGHHVFP